MIRWEYIYICMHNGDVNGERNKDIDIRYGSCPQTYGGSQHMNVLHGLSNTNVNGD